MAEDAQTKNRDEGNDDRRQKLDRVRRRLDFGTDSLPAEEYNFENEEAAQKFFRKQVEDASAKWNFDFANEMPLEGDWEWEKVESRNQLDYKELTTERKIKKDEENRNV
ncbi:hypothetical protein HHI36_011256 [Cryptolaemus montrouzieri]|uniref:Cyclin-dependent kinase inhibitor domain-containing protein n=1 Tax=Cryptolaemus montrouzieri TaxID=559131 RepID=A0ABD2MM16_9CUCU